eukprot:292594-Rhodomonas_salina.4
MPLPQSRAAQQDGSSCPSQQPWTGRCIALISLRPSSRPTGQLCRRQHLSTSFAPLQAGTRSQGWSTSA